MKRPALLPSIAVAVWLAFSAGWRPLKLPDEGRYPGIAWEMLASGQWLVPTIDGLPFFHKPPLFYWIDAGALAVLGNNAWAARVPSLLGALLALACLHALLRRWSDERRARWAVIVLATQPMWFGGAQFANLDMLVAGCITATVALAAQALLSIEHGRPHRAWLAGAHAMAALAVLAKGAIGVLLPVLVVLVWLALVRRLHHVKQLLWWPALALFAAIALPWFVAMAHAFNGFWHYFFIVHHVQRFAEGGFNNVQPFWFLVVAVAVLTLPWSPGLLAALRARGSDPPQRQMRVLMWVWLVVVLLFFSLPRSKLAGYALPALPPLAALVADGIWALSRDAVRTERRLRAVTLVAALVCIAAVFSARSRDQRSNESLAQALAARRGVDDAVIFIERYHYDVPFYARLRPPVWVVEPWRDLKGDDDWRKELADAARFAPEQKRHVLVEPHELAVRVCDRPVNWLFAPADAATRHPVLAAAVPVAHTTRTTLWRLEARHAGCLAAPAPPTAFMMGSDEAHRDLR